MADRSHLDSVVMDPTHTFTRYGTHSSYTHNPHDTPSMYPPCLCLCLMMESLFFLELLPTCKPDSGVMEWTVGSSQEIMMLLLPHLAVLLGCSLKEKGMFVSVPPRTFP